ncbi:MAG: membrane protein insertion efficiency factor YidD [Bacteroidota bacterium]|nr:membrane protein insertion efficiency factor YidD [Bacteroidota bacterium]MDP4192496.1 membrane protein insertion efficiency factor YidD [Bacteroidota bacterium]MDP4194909.1 membrane protein insertion efficiency factor YidD [Bacteroidota bacterium]
MRSVILIFIISFFSSHLIFAQTDWQRWAKAEISYSTDIKSTVNNSPETVENKNSETFGGVFLNTSKLLYNFFISDLDGDNCPFQPTCSSFFVQSVKATNIFQGILMFSDRFTRDMNLVKINHYAFSKNMHLFDPVTNYMLKPGKIRYIPPSEFANE